MAKRRRAGRPPASARAHPVRDRILDAADRLFYHQGIGAVGVDRILDEADAAKASLYANFPSKEKLVQAYLERRGLLWRDQVTTALARSTRDPRGKILEVFDLLEAAARSPDFRGCPFQNATSELGGDNRPVRTVVAAQRQWARVLFHGLLREAHAADAAALADAILILYDGGTISAMIDERPELISRARWAAAQLLDAPSIAKRE